MSLLQMSFPHYHTLTTCMGSGPQNLGSGPPLHPLHLPPLFLQLVRTQGTQEYAYYTQHLPFLVLIISLSPLSSALTPDGPEDLTAFL